MNVKTTEARQFQNLLWKNLPKSRHCDEFRLKLAQVRNELFIARFLRLQNRQPNLLGNLFHWRWLKFQIAALGPIRLRHGRNELKGRLVQQRSQAYGSKLGSAHE